MLLPAKHRLARKKAIKWSDLASEKFLLLHEVHSLSITVRRLLAANHLKPEVVLQGAQLATIAAMVAAGLGVTVVPEMMLHTEFVKGCVAVPFARPVPTRELVLLRNPVALREQGRRSLPRGSRGGLYPEHGERPADRDRRGAKANTAFGVTWSGPRRERG